MRRLLEYGAYRALGWLVPLLPRRAVVWLGRRSGALYYWLSPRTRRIGLENLRRVFPERSDHARILRRSLRVQAVALLDALWSARLTQRKARRYVRIEPEAEAAFLSACAQGSGVVVATAHFGSWEMFNVAGGTMQLPPVTVIAREIRNRRIDRHFRRTRERTGNQIVYRREALAACLAALRRGEVVCSVIDIAVMPSEGGIFVDFLGTPAMTSAALPMLAVRRHAELFFIVCRPVDKGLSYVIESERIEIRRDANTDEEVARVTAELNRALERRVRERPEAWLWGYKRWKWRPGEAGQEQFPSYSLWVHPLW